MTAIQPPQLGRRTPEARNRPVDAPADTRTDNPPPATPEAADGRTAPLPEASKAHTRPAVRTIRSRWPAAQHLQQAADQLRDLGPGLHPDLRGYADPVAEWLDKTANEMAWLAPFRDHEGGRRPWQVATRIAHTTLGLPDPDACPTCHTRVRPGAVTEGAGA